jgi:hypothetical protein
MAEGEFEVIEDVISYKTELGTVAEVIASLETYMETMNDSSTIIKVWVVRVSNSEFFGICLHGDFV